MKQGTKNLILLALMVASALTAWALMPSIMLADQRPKILLEQLIPDTFGDWRASQQSPAAIVNPQLQDKLNSLYSEILVRNYINSAGNQVMLSIAYGRDQRSYLAAHYPEVCYPAQGFSLRSNRISDIAFNDTRIPVRRLETALGTQRYEPVTYWTTIGKSNSLGGFKKRLIELKYGLDGTIPDGLIFRVSSIGKDSDYQFQIHENFIKSILIEIDHDKRPLLTGTLMH